jgi:hypothetical protein
MLSSKGAGIHVILYYNNVISDALSNIEREYERHVVMKHPGKTAYPSEIDLKKEGLN